MLCSNDDLPNGCKTPDKCIAKQKDDAGMICEQQQCPFNCTDKQHLCVGDVDTKKKIHALQDKLLRLGDFALAPVRLIAKITKFYVWAKFVRLV